MQIEDLPRLTDEERESLDDCASIPACPVGAPPKHRRRCWRLLAVTLLALAGCGGRFYVAGELTTTDVTYVEVDLKSGETFPRSRNPFGVAALGYEVEAVPRLILSLEGAHQSSLRTSEDRGENSVSARARWYLSK